MFAIILDDICSLYDDLSRLTWPLVGRWTAHVPATCCKRPGQTLGTRSGMEDGATKVLYCSGRLVNVKRLEDQEVDMSYRITLQGSSFADLHQ